MDALNCAMNIFDRKNIAKVYEGIESHHMLLYFMALGFCMRWDILYCRNWEELIFKMLPLQILCLLLGIGLEFVVRNNIENKFPGQKKIVQWAYFSIVYIVLISTGILWTRYTDLTLLVMYSLVIGLLRIIEKNKIGIFASGDKTLLRKLLMLIFTFFIVMDMAYKPMDRPKQSGVNSVISVEAEQLLDANAEKLKSFSESKWEKMSIDEKLDLLQIVTNIELNHLGLDHELKVHATTLGKNTNACYRPKEKSVNVNIKRLEYAKGYEMLTSVAHESFHAYQHRMVETYKTAGAAEKKLLYFRKLEKYDKEMSNYISGKADYEAYYNQSMEIDARAYGKERAAYYHNKLNLTR